jgi:hypothetical protein
MLGSKPAVVLLACWLAALALAGGCEPPAPPATRRPSVEIDPCAERLHDVCGQMLLYYSSHRALPKTLRELKAAGGQPSAPLQCPVSRKLYRYNPQGLDVADQPGKLVLYDPEPCHCGMRWGIFVIAPASGTLLTTRVILLPDEAIAKAEARSASSGRPASRPDR